MQFKVCMQFQRKSFICSVFSVTLTLLLLRLVSLCYSLSLSNCPTLNLVIRAFDHNLVTLYVCACAHMCVELSHIQ